MDDPRFKKFSTDPKFRVVPKKERKIKIDPRFKSMFSDKRFINKVSVDKRGRPKSFATKENFEKFYELESSSSSSEDEEEETEATNVSEHHEAEETDAKPRQGFLLLTPKGRQRMLEEKKKSKKSANSFLESDNVVKEKQKKVKEKKKKTKDSSSDDASDNEVSDEMRSKLVSDEIDYARGEGALLSDSSSEEDSSDEEEDEIDEEAADGLPTGFDKWGELDVDAERSDDSTKRLAICNMDWDRVGAQDIFIALNSFCPVGESVQKVSIYTSEFGKERLAEEDVLGPRELREGSSTQKERSVTDVDDDGEADEETRERIRIYQVNRLKYYYAVAEFSSVNASEKVYQECDGMEYELSATRFDLRFIPDEMTFDEETPKEVCDKLPRPEEYKPKFFVNTALKQGKVNLTWDETDPNRMQVLRKAFEAKDDDDADDIKAYLANSSDEEDDNGDNKIVIEDDLGGEFSSEDDEAVLNKYKSLLSGIGNKESKVKSETDMEVSWIPSDVVNEVAKKKQFESMTPWEQYLEKKKEKRKAKKMKNKVDRDEDESDDEDKPFSDDELPEDIDPNDPFFKMADDDREGKQKSKDKKSRQGKKNRDSKTQSGEEKEENGLSLLLMESDDDRNHFDYKDIVKSESKSGKKKKLKKKLNKNSESAPQDSFKIDLSDNRFSAIFQKAEFNVDPSNPNFKKTKSMEAVVQEKQRRLEKRHKLEADGDNSSKTSNSESSSSKKAKTEMSSKSNLDSLVQAVKAKSKRMGAQK